MKCFCNFEDAMYLLVILKYETISVNFDIVLFQERWDTLMIKNLKIKTRL